MVGDVGMGVSRPNIYHKELSILMSRSYGPGRYDPQYEEQGIDYPVGYVRWTEKRNMEAFLDLLSNGSLNVAPLLQTRYRVDEAANGYADISSSKSYTAIIDYGANESTEEVFKPHARLAQPAAGNLRIGCVGAGGFARGMIFPNFRKVENLSLESVATSSGVAAESARRSFGFARAQTPDELLANPDVNAVFIISRHDSHAAFVLQALERGKSVFVEKPLAVNRRQLDDIQLAYRDQEKQGKSPFLMVGFNRRFSPAAEQIRAFWAQRREPMVIHVRVNAGYLPPNHWVHESGGRVVGEFCHFIDLARSLAGSPIRTVSSVAIPDGARYSRDNIVTTLTFTDGSVATLTYLANGDRSVPKEHVEVFCEGSVARLNDFSTLELIRGGKTRSIKCNHDKGHKRELEQTLQAMRSGGPAPIPFSELVEVTAATFSIHESIVSDRTIEAAQGELTALASEPV